MVKALLNSLFFTFILFSCTSPEQAIQLRKPLFTLLNENTTGIDFINKIENQKDFNITSYRNYYNGGGVAIGDINADGLADVYMSSNMEPNKLYLNKGDFKFEDITETAHVSGTKMWSTGVTMSDVNGDGLLDIYVCNSGGINGENKENELFINNGDLTFTESAKEYGLNNSGYSTHASFFDYDLDGDLDCYILNNSFSKIDKVDQYTVARESRVEEGDKLLKNDNGKYVDVTEKAGIYSSWIGFGLGVSVSDINGDMYPDIYVSNDFWERDYLYINKQDGTFSEELIERTDVISASSMGSDIADLNNDGFLEIFTTEMLPANNHRLKTLTKFEETNIKELKVKSSYHYQQMQNSYHVNDGRGNFQELAFMKGLAATDWSWGALVFDMNNDGWKDIFVSNGIYHDITSMDFADFVADRDNIRKIVEEKGKFDFDDLISYLPSTPIANYAFLNQRGKEFVEMTDSLGLGTPSFSNGAAYGDLDNDGDLDLVVNNVNMLSFVYRNETNEMNPNNYLKVSFEGDDANKFGIGALVEVFSGGKKQVMQNYQARGFESSTEPNLIFGLGSVTKLDSLVITWADLKSETLYDLPANQVIELVQSNANDRFTIVEKESQPIFEEVSNVLIGNTKHTENNFNDFDVERLLPRKISTEGPKILTGDLNGDRLDDFVLLGAFGDQDKLFIQRKGGSFVEKKQTEILIDSICESTSGVLADLDNDGDLDIVIGAGGNERGRPSTLFTVRYYENNGNAEFRKVLGMGPSVIGNFSKILAQDFDEDGDLDLFFAGRIVPGNYGLIPRSFLYRNDEDGWKNISPDALSGAGMVTDAVWSDYNCDGRKDLIVVGEWMPIVVFPGNGPALAAPIVLPDSYGWWTSIEAADLNNDGLDDYVLGNWGLNTKFKATKEKPLTMFVKDFDKNGKSDFIINWFPPEDTIAYPFASKADITAQMPVLKKDAFTYEEYARQTYENMFTKEQRKGAISYMAMYLESAVLLNIDHKFEIRNLPVEAQVSPVTSLVVDDLDNDGHMDILALGNFHGLKPEVGRHDASESVFLKGDGEGNFEYVSNQLTGMSVSGEVRDAVQIKNAKEEELILLARNNLTMKVYKKSNTQKKK